jgi:hypothetical protein
MKRIYTLSIMHPKIKIEKGVVQIPLLLGIVFGILVLSIGGYKGFEFYRTSKSNQLSMEVLLKLKEAQEETDKTKIPQLLSEAINLAKKATDLSPNNAKAWFNRGEIYFNSRLLAMNAREWAIKCYQKALELDPNAPFSEKARERIKQLEEEMVKEEIEKENEKIKETPACVCTDWVNKGCGIGGCASNKILQVRNCSPSSCQEEFRCVDDKSCVSEKLEKEKETFSASVIKKEETTTCICDTWKNMGCGEENCSFDEMYQKRFCLPAGCNKESQCVKNEDCVHPINEEVKAGDLKWKIVKVKNRGSMLRGAENFISSWMRDKITEGKFIEVEMTVENVGKEPYSFISYSPEIYDEKKRKFRDIFALGWIPTEKDCIFFHPTIAPGFSPKDCGVIFEVAKDSTNLWLYVPSTDWSEKGKFIYLGSF